MSKFTEVQDLPITIVIGVLKRAPCSPKQPDDGRDAATMAASFSAKQGGQLSSPGPRTHFRMASPRRARAGARAVSGELAHSHERAGGGGGVQ